MPKIVVTDKAPLPIGPYSQGVIANRLVFTAGQVGVDPATSSLAADIETQTRQTIRNIEEVLRAAGCSLDDVIKTTIYLTDINDYTTVNTIYETYFKKAKPARATVGIMKLPQGSFHNPPLIEIEAIAVLP